jgi:cystathionine beta-lyase/cystathionine gamma-synthase
MKPQSRRNGFETRAIHDGYDPGDRSGALAPLVFLTSTYVTLDDIKTTLD